MGNINFIIIFLDKQYTSNFGIILLAGKKYPQCTFCQHRGYTLHTFLND